jgi:hypothetical protein
MRPNTTQRNHWAQVRIGACALLVPPLTLGAALYSMLATPDDGTAPPAATAARDAAGEPEPLRGTMQPWAASADPQPAAAQAIQAVAGNSAPGDGRRAVPATGAGHVAAGSAENAALVSRPVPVKVAMDRSAGANPPPPANLAGASPASLGTWSSQSAPSEMSTALLPRVLNSSSQALPQTQPPRMPAVQTPAAPTPPAADPPSAEGPPPAAKRSSNPANRSETAAARRHAQLQRQHAFSLKNWLQQIGILPRNPRG